MSSIVSKAMIAAIAASAFYTVAPVHVASAQTAEIVDDRNVSVRERARPGYDAVGVRAGAFTVFPEASVTGTFNDNIYATDTNTESDFVTTLAARVSAVSTWSRHSLNLQAGLAQHLYADNDDEDRFDWDIGGDGRIDITRDTNIFAGLSYAELTEDRGAPNAAGIGFAAEPTEYSLLQANIGLDHRFNRVTSRIGATYADYDYDDTPAIGGGAPIDQDFRDREEFTQFLRLGYDVSPDTNVYVQGTLNQRDYDQTVLLNRNSDGYAVVVGSDFRLTNLAQGGIFVGYQSQEYDDPTLSEIDGLAFGANVDWFVTPLTTVRFEAASTIEETVALGASGYTDNSVGLRVDHELMRNVILGGNVSFANQDYEGTGRDDDVVRAGLGLDYLLNRNLSLRLGYDYTDRDSSAAGFDYSRNEVGLTLKAGL